MMSTPPPTGCGTTMRIGLLGYLSWPNAGRPSSDTPPAIKNFLLEMLPVSLNDGIGTIKMVSMTQPRMRDVARLAKVSAITVSRVLRSPDKVSEDTRRRVLEAVRKIGYVPNAIAGSLSSSRSNIVAAIVPTITNPVFADTIHAMAGVLREHGYHMLLGQSGASPAEERSLIETFLAPPGRPVHPGRPALSRGARAPRQGRHPDRRGRQPAQQPLEMVVSYSNFAAAEAMTEHLIARGRRRIGFVSSQRRDNDRAQARRRGYGAALKRHGMQDDEKLVLETSLGLRRAPRRSPSSSRASLSSTPCSSPATCWRPARCSNAGAAAGRSRSGWRSRASTTRKSPPRSPLRQCPCRDARSAGERPRCCSRG